MSDFENKILKKEKELEQIVNKEKALIIVKGKMLSGKTTLVLNFIKEMLMKENIKILFFNLNIEKNLIFKELEEKYINKTLYIGNDTDLINIKEIIRKSIEKVHKNGINLIVIDSLWTIQVDKSLLLSRNDEEKYILEHLRILSKGLKIPVIVTQNERGKDLEIMTLNEKYNMNIDDYTYSVNDKEITFEEFLEEYKKLFRTDIAFIRAKERLKEKLNETEFANWNIIGRKENKHLKVTRKNIKGNK